MISDKWKKKVPGHWYEAQCGFVTEAMGEGEGEVLVVGSPLFELREIEDLGWRATYLDLRRPSNFEFYRFINSDVRSSDLEDASFDVVTSTCVLCHVGTGRYGDKVDPDGDFEALKELRRVLKPEGVFLSQLGPVADITDTLTLKDHRIYTIRSARKMLLESGFAIRGLVVWNTDKKEWRNALEKPTSSTDQPDYLSVFCVPHVVPAYS